MNYFDQIDGPLGPPPSVHLFSCGLLSKWGFSDGDLLDDFRDYLGCEWDALDDNLHGPRHVLLIALVREKLLPTLAQKVDAEEICTIHNPIRARTVDGEDVSHLHYDVSCDKPRLTPECVEIPGEEVLAIARRIIAENAKK